MIALAAAACLSATPCAAQVERSPAAASPSCELHLWPASEVKGFEGGTPGIRGGALMGVLIAAATKEADQRGRVKVDVLSPEHQLAEMSALDLPEMLGLAGARVVSHAKALPRLTAATTGARHASSASTCYAELIVTQLFVDHSPMARREFRSLVVYRSFGASPVPVSTFTTWAATGLTRFPARTEADQEAAKAELVSAFGANLRKFASYASKSRKTERR